MSPNAAGLLCLGLALLPWILAYSLDAWRRMVEDRPTPPADPARDRQFCRGTRISVRAASISGVGSDWKIQGCGQTILVPTQGTYELDVDGRGPTLVVKVNGAVWPVGGPQ